MPPELALLSTPAARRALQRSASSHPTLPTTAPLSLIVHAGQRWIQACDRARPLLSRLSQHHPVLFVEPPMHAAVEHPLMQLSEPHPQVIRAVPLLPLRAPQEADGQRALTAWLLGALLPSSPAGPSTRIEIESLVVGLPEADWDGDLPSGHASALRLGRSLAERFSAPLQWFNTPLDAPVLIGRVGSLGTVYDRACAMLHPDRWHPGFADRDRGLLRQADLVLFSGEPGVSPGRQATLRNGQPQDRPTQVAQALRAAWDAKAALVHTRLMESFGGRRRRPLPSGFLAASVQAFGLQ
jgi:hypothetical protein